jgi:uncharacterized protein (DUF3820 family)
MALTDNDPMPFGKYKNEKMANVPASYLLWIYDEWTLPNPRFGFQNKEVKAYIEENLDVLKSEVKNK